MFYAEEFSNPTRALSPRQLPTDPVHAVPTREYQSDPIVAYAPPRSSALLSKTKPAQSPPAGTCSRYAARRQSCHARTARSSQGRAAFWRGEANP